LPKTLIGLVAAVLVVAVVLRLYATGPSRKAGKTVYPASSNPTAAAAFCIVRGNRAYLAQRTNAWQRFKGAITGNP
jgi:hypothetical protein